MVAELDNMACIRRVDDLGRVAIPKQIRNQMLLNENDPLEIFTGDGFVAFRKFETDSFRARLENLAEEFHNIRETMDASKAEEIGRYLKAIQEISRDMD